MDIKTTGLLLKEAFTEWNEDKAPRLAAAVAYYTIFSLAPLLIVAIAIAGFVYGEAAARGQIVGQIASWVGKSSAEAIQTMLISVNQPDKNIVAAVIGVVTLLVGASGLFGQLQDTLNTVWDVESRPGGGLVGIIKSRALAFAMVLGTGLLLLALLVVSAGLSAAGKFLTDYLPTGDFVWQPLDFLVSFAVLTLTFAAIFKILPQVRIEWSDVWIGATFTSFLFNVGKLLIGLYLGRSSATSAYGAAGSLVLILVWIYYSAQLFFFGAEFTQVYARRFGSRRVSSAVPAAGDELPPAVPVPGPLRRSDGVGSRPSPLRSALLVVVVAVAMAILGYTARRSS